jgi:hypothetical protein
MSYLSPWNPTDLKMERPMPYVMRLVRIAKKSRDAFRSHCKLCPPVALHLSAKTLRQRHIGGVVRERSFSPVGALPGSPASVGPESGTPERRSRTAG